jgi:hypothetical protein
MIESKRSDSVHREMTREENKLAVATNTVLRPADHDKNTGLAAHFRFVQNTNERLTLALECYCSLHIGAVNVP